MGNGWRVLTIASLLVLTSGQAGANAKQVRAAGNSWAAALSGGKSKPIAAHYDKRSILWGTFSASLRGSKPKINKYFKDLMMQKKNLKVEFAPRDRVRMLGEDHAIRTGSYTFSFDTEAGRKTIPARYSFVYGRKEGGDWKIIDHHSSEAPTAEISK